MFLVDTSVWVDYFNGAATKQSNQPEQLLGTGRILIGDLILAELLQGFAIEDAFRRARRLLLPLPYADLAGKSIALAAAINYRRLRALGFTVRKTIDVIIGTFCIVNGHELLHADRDFEPMKEILGLAVFKTIDGIGRPGDEPNRS